MNRTVLLGDLVQNGWLTYGDGNYSSKYPKVSELLDAGEIPFISGKNLKNGRISYEGMRYISPGLHTELKKGHIKTNDTLLVTRAGVGAVAYVSEDFNDANINAQLVFLRPDGMHVNHNYLYQLLSSDLMRKRLISHSSGSAQGQLPIKSLLSVKVDLPGIDEQKKIADILGAIDEKIELNRKMNETLEQMGQALFRHYFIDNPNTEKWTKGTLNDIVTLNPRESIPRNTAATYLEMKNIPETGMSIKATETRNFTSGMKFRNGDTLLARITPCLENGKTAFVDFLKNNEIGFGSTEYIVMRPNQAALTEYTYFLARSNVFRAYAIQSMVGTSGRQRVQYDSIATYEISIPEARLIDEFHDSMKESFVKIRNNAQQIQTLTTLRDILLPRLINGKIKL